MSVAEEKPAVDAILLKILEAVQAPDKLGRAGFLGRLPTPDHGVKGR
jgi:hypothetical protein